MPARGNSRWTGLADVRWCVMGGMDPHDGDPVGCFMDACLDWLEEGELSGVPVPSLEGMTPSEVEEARFWLSHLAASREAYRMEV